ncbi:DUF3993 domain-containing protein [Bacillus suaedaesalsae]|uniref:DUF3993 domain-containing protein n=1 Tax=Bacillus suaedaesalsae TaxID=2810349 RepID=A0ABS2DGT6_9BACI|nr:DUF3993 domain-containing protein [Bacillus suaedaesalsae]MBM6617626.1 DUF3993 domain-containing protein [Bacillus suaedaesalsae]
MMKSHSNFVLIVITIIGIMFMPKEMYAAKPMDIEEIKALLKSADDAQYSLTEKHYSWEEALHTLTPYMTEEFATAFMNEHLFSEEEGYIYYGTDFSIYHIPHYAFNDRTTVVMSADQTKIFVYELFSGTGPVMFKNQYEVVTFVYENETWKINNISYLKELTAEIENGTIIEIPKEEVEENESSSIGVQESTSTMYISTYSKYIAVVPYFSIMKHSNTLFALDNKGQAVSIRTLANASYEN